MSQWGKPIKLVTIVAQSSRPRGGKQMLYRQLNACMGNKTCVIIQVYTLRQTLYSF